MNFIADLHVHSKYSIATAKNLDLEHLYVAAQMKGISVVGTGDFTHPAWFNEIQTKLQPAESGLYTLKEKFAARYNEQIPTACRRSVRFVLVSEISNIYKKNQKTRKNHNLIFMPDRRTAKIFNDRLDRIGNIKADGRPILGLDAKKLLEIMLEVSDQAFLVPAHIWTPWFSVLGSKSGFDSLEECFEDLTDHIFAVETGLSSDPAMNWRVSGLDRLTLISNSDAHSPFKLGREANRFNCELSFHGMKTALKTGNPEQFLGTYEYYPEEGKYHLDGHRKCGVRLWPDKTIDRKGICPVCAKPLTLGVLYRVEELADRPPDVKPPKHHPFNSMIPLVDILAELRQKGPQTKIVQQTYHSLLAEFGSEFAILHEHEPETLQTSELPLLGEAIRRMRTKEIKVNPGFDGEFGKIRIFKEGEQAKLTGQKTLFNLPAGSVPSKKIRKIVFKSRAKLPRHKRDRLKTFPNATSDDMTAELSDSQRKVVEHPQGPLLVMAGPGTGKTRALTHRIAYLIKFKQVPAEKILAVTFTHKAAREMRERLRSLLGQSASIPLATTFHSLCLKILRAAEQPSTAKIIDEVEQDHLIQEAKQALVESRGDVAIPIRKLKRRVLALKQKILGPTDELSEYLDKNEVETVAAFYGLYQKQLERYQSWDYEDLIMKSVQFLESDKKARSVYQQQYQYVFIDEYQDLNEGQYRLIKLLAPRGRGVCAIGDPNQAIYGFRGSDVSYFKRFKTDFPGATVLHLARNYRSTQTILKAANQVIRVDMKDQEALQTYSQIDGTRTIHILKTPTAKAEAVAVGKIIERLVGGTGFHSIDFGTVDGHTETRSFRDFGVLYRTRSQSETLIPVFERAGLPFQVASRQNRYHEGVLGDLLALIKTLQGVGTFFDFKNIVKWMGTGIGDKTWQRLKSWAHENAYDLNEALFQARRLPIPGMRAAQQSKINTFVRKLEQLKTETAALTGADKLHRLIERTPLQGRCLKTSAEDELRPLYAAADQFGPHTKDMLTHLALESDTDLYDPNAEKVSLMTLHAAKGLEFPVVFIVGCEDDYLPHRRSPVDPVDIEEERRLFYVAMTRAQEQLFLSWAQFRQIYGKKTKRSLSPFVQDIEAQLKTQTSASQHKKQPDGPKQLNLF